MARHVTYSNKHFYHIFVTSTYFEFAHYICSYVSLYSCFMFTDIRENMTRPLAFFVMNILTVLLGLACPPYFCSWFHKMTGVGNYVSYERIDALHNAWFISHTTSYVYISFVTKSMYIEFVEIKLLPFSLLLSDDFHQPTPCRYRGIRWHTKNEISTNAILHTNGLRSSIPGIRGII